MTAKKILKEIDKRLDHLDGLRSEIEEKLFYAIVTEAKRDKLLLTKRLIEIDAEREILTRMKKAY